MAKSKGRSSIQLRPKHHKYGDDPMWDRFPWCIAVWLLMLLTIGGVLYAVYYVVSLLWRTVNG